MSRSIRWSLAALLAAATSATGAGCGSGGSSSGGGGASVAGSTSSTAPSSTVPGSTVSSNVPPSTTGTAPAGGVTVGTLAGGTTGKPGTTGTGTGTGTTTLPPTGGTAVVSNGPTIVVTSPARASFTTQGAALVQGTVTDPAGVAVLTINGTPALMGAGGSFSEPVALTPGLNTIIVEATNPQNQSGKVSLSLLYGQFRPDGQAITDALAVRLNQGSFDDVSKIAASQFTGASLAALLMAKNPLFTKTISLVGLTLTSAEVDCTAASFGNPTVTLTPGQGYVAVHLVIPNVNVSVNAHDVPGSGIIPYSINGNVTADSATFDAEITVTVANGVVTTAVLNDSMTLQNFNWGLSGFPSFLTSLATSTVQNMITSQVDTMAQTQIPAQVNQMLAGVTGKPITQTIMGATATFNLTPTYINFDPAGANVKADADLSISPVASYTPYAAPGSLYTGGAAPMNGGPSPAFLASINEDLMNRAGHAVWKSGLMQITIDGSPGSLIQLPSFIPLDMGLLQLFLPELQGKAPPGDPIALVVNPLLPPVFQVQSGADLVQVGIGDLELEVFDMVNPAAPKLVLQIALHAKVGANASVNAQNTFDVHVGSLPTIDCSLAASPLAPTLNLTGLDSLVGFIVPPVIQLVGNTWSGFPIPIHPGLTPVNVQIVQDGAQGTFVTAKGDVQ